MEISKIGGSLWTAGITPVPNTGNKAATGGATEQSGAASIKLDAASDFLKDTKNIKSSTSMDRMLALKRSKKERQFMFR